MSKSLGSICYFPLGQESTVIDIYEDPGDSELIEVNFYFFHLLTGIV